MSTRHHVAYTVVCGIRYFASIYSVNGLKEFKND